jgi:hypothetical protein
MFPGKTVAIVPGEINFVHIGISKKNILQRNIVVY